MFYCFDGFDSYTARNIIIGHGQAPRRAKLPGRFGRDLYKSDATASRDLPWDTEIPRYLSNLIRLSALLSDIQRKWRCPEIGFPSYHRNFPFV